MVIYIPWWTFKKKWSRVDVMVLLFLGSEMRFVKKMGIIHRTGIGHPSKSGTLENWLVDTVCDGWRLECVYCGSLSDHESILLVSTEKRSLYCYYRSHYGDEWKEIFHMLSPNEDIYYTSMHCLPLQPASNQQDVLVFLAGTDNRLYLYNLNVSDHSLTMIVSFTVFLFLSYYSSVLRTG